MLDFSEKGWMKEAIVSGVRRTSLSKRKTVRELNRGGIRLLGKKNSIVRTFQV